MKFTIETPDAVDLRGLFKALGEFKCVVHDESGQPVRFDHVTQEVWWNAPEEFCVACYQRELADGGIEGLRRRFPHARSPEAPCP